MPLPQKENSKISTVNFRKIEILIIMLLVFNYILQR